MKMKLKAYCVIQDSLMSYSGSLVVSLNDYRFLYLSIFLLLFVFSAVDCLVGMSLLGNPNCNESYYGPRRLLVRTLELDTIPLPLTIVAYSFPNMRRDSK
jgi:hypothetical protein